jgi:hypothetical protein
VQGQMSYQLARMYIVEHWRMGNRILPSTWHMREGAPETVWSCSTRRGPSTKV